MAANQTYTLRLLGSLEIEGNRSQPITLRRKARALLAYLAVSSQLQPRHELATLFCAEADDPGRALRLLLSRIRRRVKQNILVAAGDAIGFNAQAGWVDCLAFEQEMKSGDPTPDAINLYRGNFLSNLALPDAPEFELWVLSQRSYYRQLYERGLIRLISQLSDQKQYEAAIPFAQKLVQSNSLLEEGHARLIWLYAQTGQRKAALAQYEQCRAWLVRELAVGPGDTLRQLATDIRNGRLGRPDPPRLESAVAPQAQPANSLFVGREAELRQIATAWESKHGGVILISAPAGGGKTSLVAKFRERFLALTCLNGRCYESTRGLPYQPWIELIQAYLADIDDETLAPLSPLTRAYLVRLVPNFASRPGQTAPPAPATAGGEVQRVFIAVRELLEPLVQKGGVLFIDDLQWADEISLQLFHFLARQIQGTRLLLIGAFRAEEVAGAPALQTLLADLRRAPVLELALTPLDEQDINQIATRLWPALPISYRPRLLTMLHSATGGNPLFVTEVLNELAHTMELPGELPIPATVRELIHRRLQSFPDNSRQVIETIALFDSEITWTEVQQISTRSEEETAQAIDLGLQRGLLTADTADHAARYNICHDLMRQAIRSQIMPARRRLLHRRTAVLLAQVAEHTSLHAKYAVAGRITQHAQQGEEYELLFQWAQLAADYAMELHAYADAFANYAAAAQAYKQLQHRPHFASRNWRLNYAEILIYQVLLGDYVNLSLADEEGLLRRACTLIEQNPDTWHEALCHLGRASHDKRKSRFAAAIKAATIAYEQFVSLDETRYAARCLVLVGQAQIRTSQNRAGRESLEQALPLYETAGDYEGISLCLSGMAWSALNLGEIEQALSELDHALAIVTKQHDILGQARVYYTLAAAWNYYYHTENMTRYARKAIRLYEQAGHDRMALRCHIYLAQSHRYRGEMDAAKKVLALLYEDARKNHDSWLEAWVISIFNKVAFGRGRLKEVAKWTQAAYDLRQRTDEQQNQVYDLVWMGRLKLAQGDIPAALTFTAQAVEQMEKARNEYYVWEAPDVYLGRAEALNAAQEIERSQDFILCAYHELQRFVNQTKNTNKRRVLNQMMGRRVMTAWQRGEAQPFSNFANN